MDPLNYGVNSPNYGLHADGHGHGIMGIDDRWHTSAEGNWKTDPQTNVNVGAHELSDLLKSYPNLNNGRPDDAEHSYNAGSPGNASNPSNYSSLIDQNYSNLQNLATNYFNCATQAASAFFKKLTVGLGSAFEHLFVKHAA
jgi:hypothetical protein